LEFAILTAARTTETLGARWSEVDMEAGIWSVPAHRMKARRDHRVPLSKAALPLLEALPRDPKSDFLFISPNKAGEQMSNAALLATLKRMGRRDITAHGFRSAFRDWAAETTAYPDAVVEMALAHAIGNAVEAAYRRGDCDPGLMDCDERSGKAEENVSKWSGYVTLTESPCCFRRLLGAGQRNEERMTCSPEIMPLVS
jgi:integrase